MKVTIEYDDERDAIVALAALRYKASMTQFEAHLRQVRKHGDHGEEAAKVLDELWDIWIDWTRDLPGYEGV